MRLVGYADRLSVAPGERIAFMVSSELPMYHAEIVQLIHGDPNPAGPGFKIREVASEVSGSYVGKLQRLRPGSYVRIPLGERLEFPDGFSIHLWIRSTTPERPLQTLISSACADGGFAVQLNRGRLALRLARGTAGVMLDRPLVAQAWYSVAVVFDVRRGEARLALEAPELTATRLSAAGTFPLHAVRITSGSEILIAAECLIEKGSRSVGNFFNGKIEGPALYGRALSAQELSALRSGTPWTLDGLLAAWDFAEEISSTRILDRSPHARHGRTVNRPMRAVTGHTWDGSETVWKNAPWQYSAIHFHDDDLDDADWEESVAWRVPEGTPSAIYALHVRAGSEEDYIPFAVRPKRGVATADIVFLMPTFSYLAYGNSRMAGRPEVAAVARMIGGAKQSRWPSSPEDRYAAANHLNSLYDTHSDGSGCCYASWRRPIVSMRPKYMSEILGVPVPHQLSADLHLIDWLVEQGYRFDVVADENLHLEGEALLHPYKVVLTGTHPEYWSQEMIRACQRYLHEGGRMMYLGGNGMYWVTQLDREKGHTIEMRRTQPSSPHFYDPHPGELHLSTTGERAGLWRHRGLPTQAWLGVVMSGSGLTGQHYVRQPDSFDDCVSWIFEGIGRTEHIGNFRNLHSGYGAGGGELDRADFRIEGTPHHTRVLASTAPLDRTWLSDPAGPPHAPRGDLVLLEYPNGGGVFSVSSIAWCSCLSHDRYRNNVSRLTRNVLEGFLNRKALLSESDAESA